MWTLHNERPDLNGTVNGLALKLGWGFGWREKLNVIFDQRFNTANDRLVKAAAKGAEPSISPSFAIDEWNQILESLVAETREQDMLELKQAHQEHRLQHLMIDIQ